jgi:hypothetical protein
VKHEAATSKLGTISMGIGLEKVEKEILTESCEDRGRERKYFTAKGEKITSLVRRLPGFGGLS